MTTDTMNDKAPERWRLVPEEPTDAMLNAPEKPTLANCNEHHYYHACKAMLAAVPSPPAISGEEEEVIKDAREMADHLERKSAQLLKDVGVDPTPHAAVPILRKAASLADWQAQSLRGLTQAYADLDQTSRVKISDLQVEIAELQRKRDGDTGLAAAAAECLAAKDRELAEARVALEDCAHRISLRGELHQLSANAKRHEGRPNSADFLEERA